MGLADKERERLNKIQLERSRLIAMTDSQAESLSVSERYDRIRYLREIEAAQLIEEIRRTLPASTNEEGMSVRQKFYDKPTKVIYEKD